MSFKTIWHGELLERLRELAGHADRYSARQIAEMLHVKRNAVIGACARNKIQLQWKHWHHIGEPKPAKPSRKRIKRWKPKPEAKVQIEMPFVSSRNVSMLELGTHDCRYPTGDGPFLFCGNPTQDGSSYCPHHHALCWEKPKKPQKPDTYREFKRKAA